MKKSQLILAIAGVLSLIVGLFTSLYYLDLLGLLFLLSIVVLRSKKYDLLKMSLGMVLICFLLTWIIPKADFSTGKYAVGEITRMGIFDLFTDGLATTIYYFFMMATFIFVLGAFYQFLSKLDAYQKLTSSIAEKIKGKEIIFSVIISFIIAVLSSIINEQYVIIAFIPFIITILDKAGMNKMSTFITTFGAILVGILGSIVSTKIVGMNVQYFQLDYNYRLKTKIAFFLVIFVIYTLFNVLYLRKNTVKVAKVKSTKTKKSQKETKEEVVVTDSIDLFENKDVDSKNANIIPLVIVGILLLIVSILAYLPWTTVFNVSWFTDAYNWFIEFKLFGAPIFSYIFGSQLQEFGNWTLITMQIVMIITMLILQLCYRVNINDFVESISEGVKKVSKLVMLVILSYSILVLTVVFPVIPTIANKILTTKFNVFNSLVSGMFAGLFNADYQYTVNLLYYNFYELYPNNLKVVSVILQSTYGLMSFITPASAILFVGLRYLNISYKEYMKYIWKFLLAAFVLVIALAFFVM